MNAEHGLEAVLAELVRRVVREELQVALVAARGEPGPAGLYRLAQVAKVTNVSVASLKRLRASGCLVPDGTGKLARYTVESVREALRLEADSRRRPRK
jgi:hypothetical protein